MAANDGTMGQPADNAAHLVEHALNSGIGPASLHYGSAGDIARDAAGKSPGRSHCPGIGTVDDVPVLNRSDNASDLFAEGAG